MKVLAVVAMAIVLAPLAQTCAAEPASDGCTTSIEGGTAHGGFTDTGNRECDGATPRAGGRPAEPGPTLKWIDCGPRVTGGVVATGSAGPCQQAALACAVPFPIPSPQPTTTVAEVQVLPDGTTKVISIDCEATPATPTVTPAMVSQQVQKLVPHPRVGIAPPGGVSLVNIQTLLWVDTPADQSLGTVTLLGKRVDLRVHVNDLSM